MNKTQNFLKLKINDLFFFIILFAIIVLSFVALSPKISAKLFNFKREILLNEFIKDTKTNGINPQEYWRFREFYSPGYFNFSKDGIKNPLLEQAKEKIGIKYNDKNIDLTFLVFFSPRINSLDMLTTQTDLSKVIGEKHLVKEQIIFMNKNSLIYKEGQGTIWITFLLSTDEMKKANGFFDYKDRDKEITQGKKWLNITSIRTD